MGSKFRQIVFFTIILSFLAGLMPCMANGTAQVDKEDRHMRVAMRMIGHEVLLSLCDSTSRVLPIEKEADQYKIQFEAKFGFEPEALILTVDRVMSEAKIDGGYLVEVVQCETDEVVHSFEVGISAEDNLIPCAGRVLPYDCYYLLMSTLDLNQTAINTLADTSSGKSGFGAIKNIFLSLNNPMLLVFPLLFIIGIFGYYRKMKNPSNKDSNMILIGASQFDKRNMALSYENEKIELTSKEADLLSVLFASANSPIEREVILNNVWGDEGDYVGRTLDVFISKLRKKLEPDASLKIVNIRGVGYKLVIA